MIREPSTCAGPQVLLYPSFAAPLPNSQGWVLRIQGCVFEPGVVDLRKRLMLRLLQKAMRADPSALDSDVFRQRIAGFVASPERGCQLNVLVGDRVYRVRKKTKRNGQFSAILRLTLSDMEKAHGGAVADGLWLPIEIRTKHPGQPGLKGQVQLLSETGPSVISDIDDTIKHTQVSCRRAMLANTFLREFSAIEGMADLYAGWRQQGAAFHYVSSSPWQLFEPLQDHCQCAGFPAGSMHLRSFRLRDHMLRRLLMLRRSGKAVTIRRILEHFPKRDFVLVGDSGEKDPEIYSRLARQFPQVRSVLIRDLPERPMTTARRQRTFRQLADSRWDLYMEAEELPAQLSDAGNSSPRQPAVQVL
jgi:phosphatidate phosphatase APP1